MHNKRDTTLFVGNLIVSYHPEYIQSCFKTCGWYLHSGVQYPKLLSLLIISKIQYSWRSLRSNQIACAPAWQNSF